MKRFRICWAIIVILVTLLFIGYRVLETFTKDKTGPVFSCDSDVLEVSIHDGDDVLLQGVTAKDEKDGDVTDSILIEKYSDFYEDQTRIVTYAAFDSDNHITRYERKITYTDYESPRFALTDSLRFRTGEKINLDKIVRVTDCLDGDISNNVKISSNSVINTYTPGIYEAVYEVSNSAGDKAELPVQIEIYDAVGNEVEMHLTQYLVYYEGTEINYKDYLSYVNIGSQELHFTDVLQAEDGTVISLKDKVTVNSTVNTEVPGVYPVYYYYQDTLGMIAYEATEVLYVVVE